MKNIDNLFSNISEIIGIRVTPENFREKMKDISSTRGITSRDLKEIIIEILSALVEITKTPKK